MPIIPQLTKAGKEDLALALILLRDFKSEGKFNPDLVISIVRFAQMLGVDTELAELTSKIPPMRIEPR